MAWRKAKGRAGYFGFGLLHKYANFNGGGLDHTHEDLPLYIIQSVC